MKKTKIIYSLKRNKLKSTLCTLFILTMHVVISLAQGQFEITAFAAGLNQPVDIIFADSESLYVVEKAGTIRIVNPDGSLGAIFLNIQDSIPNSGNERGLLGAVFHPDYPDSAYLFVNYTALDGATTIVRFDVTSANEANPESGQILMTVAQPYTNHNGGDLVFGPDGYLYIAIGDGGSGGDPHNHGQTLSSYLGKILRIDIDQVDPYAIPPDNPFVGNGDALDEIWAYGVRNPWRMFFDEGSNGLYFGDVGQNSKEEINFIPADGLDDPNFGWRCYEGSDMYDLSECDEVDDIEFPIFEYSHSNANNCSGSVTGGVVYRGDKIPSLRGKYIYADYCSGQIGCIDVDNGNVQMDLLDFANFQISTFGLDINGDMYLGALGEGVIYKFIPANTHYIFSIVLDGQQAGTASGGEGQGIAIYEKETSQLCVSGFFNNLTGNSNSGHLHEGLPGVSGDEIFDLEIAASGSPDGEFYKCQEISDDNFDMLMEDQLYVDIHSTAFAGGEIRGQLILRSCPEEYELIAPVIPGGQYRTQKMMVSGTFAQGESYQLLFEDEVELIQGFQVESGSCFIIQYYVCSN